MSTQNPSLAPDLQLLWSLPPNQWQLNGRDVHVWASRLDRPVEQISSFAQMLSPDELERAEGFHFERDRNRFIAGRATLRTILSYYLQWDPVQLRFAYSSRGKPTLDGWSGGGMLHFNLAHSRGVILVAVTRASAVGIDVEWIHPVTDAENIAARFFSPGEASGLEALPKNQREQAFFNLWTRKEAWLKATGDGLSETLGQIEVSFLPGEPARVLAISGNPEIAASWTLAEFIPATNFVAAIAAQAKDLKFSCWQWPF
jgi:4'-phosphopantetheinyl transferase